jgi:hypothetical protein
MMDSLSQSDCIIDTELAGAFLKFGRRVVVFDGPGVELCHHAGAYNAKTDRLILFITRSGNP